MTQKLNQKFEINELKALENRMKDLGVEDSKKFILVGGYVYFFHSGAIATISTLTSGQNERGVNMAAIGLMGVSLGFLVRGASCFVMRTEYLPPKKHALARLKDKLVEIVNDYQRKPATVPIN